MAGGQRVGGPAELAPDGVAALAVGLYLLNDTGTARLSTGGTSKAAISGYTGASKSAIGGIAGAAG